MFGRWKLSWLIVVALLIVGCKTRGKLQRRGVADKDILAEIGDSIITKKDLQNALQQLSPYVRNQYNSFARRKALLLQLVQFEVLWLEAKKQKLDNSDNVRRIRKKVMVQTLIRRTVQQIRPVDIQDIEIKKYYQANKASLKKSYAGAKDSIRAIILKQKRKVLYNKLMEQLKAKYKVTINEKVLAGVKALPKIAEQPKVKKPKRTKPAPARRAVAPRVAPAPRKVEIKPRARVVVPKPATTPSRPSTIPQPPIIRNAVSKPATQPSPRR